MLKAHGLEPVGGFVPVVLHDPAADPLPDIDRALRVRSGRPAPWCWRRRTDSTATTNGHGARRSRSGRRCCANLDRIGDARRGPGILATLHPHIGTVVERYEDVQRVLTGSHIPLCLDTGHLLIGGTDPLALARSVPDRIAHAHLKDVDAGLADRVRMGEVTYTDAVRAGMYRPLGEGDVGIAGIVTALTEAGYDGWFVLEQDTILTREPPPAAGPLLDVRRSLAFLDSL